VTLVDTSAWVEYLRGSNSDAQTQLHRLLDEAAPLHATDVVVMEVLAGARDETHATQLRRLLSRCEFVPVESLRDYESAALLYRQCRRGGETIRALTDCLIAAVAIRAGLDVLQADKDFEALERNTPLRLYSAR
jgi:predicted nucleic acid-binding protein